MKRGMLNVAVIAFAISVLNVSQASAGLFDFLNFGSSSRSSCQTSCRPANCQTKCAPVKCVTTKCAPVKCVTVKCSPCPAPPVCKLVACRSACAPKPCCKITRCATRCAPAPCATAPAAAPEAAPKVEDVPKPPKDDKAPAPKNAA